MPQKRFFIALILGCLGVATALAQMALIPQPQSYSRDNGAIDLPRSVEVVYSPASLEGTAAYLVQCLKRYGDIIATAQAGKAGAVRLQLNRRLSAGAYRLSIADTGIDIEGGDAEGVANGIATLSQLLLQGKGQLPCAVVTDAPRFAWRGFHLDVSRHFFTVPEVKRIIDLMAFYKLNRFHWHLTDDQGWRIEIKKYPLLTEKGAWRIFNDQDSVCRKQAVVTDNPDMLLPHDRIRVVGNDSLYGGYYTQDDIREIVAYARQRGIETIPEIDMPGHFLSAIENYDGISCFKKIGWGEYFTTPLCPGKEKTLEFCRDIWNEVISLFPYEYVHIGGDEVLKDNWKTCPDCQQRIRDCKLKDELELQAWFIHQMEAYLNQKGRKMLGWDEILEGGLSKTATVTWWRTWVPEAPQQVINQGNDVIFCPGSPMYFSQTEQKNNLQDVYEYDFGGLIKKTGNSGNSGKAGKAGRILGVQGNLWTEYIPTFAHACYQYFPRILALSELAWTEPAKKDFDKFSTRMTRHFELLQSLNVPYHTPSLEGFYGVNAFTGQGKLTATCKDPSAIIRYTTDGSMPTASSRLYSGPITVDQTTTFNLRLFQPNGKGGENVQAQFVKQGLLEALPEEGTLKPGLTATWYDFHEFKCTNMHLSPVKATYDVSDVCIPEGVNGHIGLIISGYIRIPADGIYTFALKSDDGSLLTIDGNLVVDNDHPQSPHEEISQQALKAGRHAFEVRYYDHNGGMLRLNVLDPNGFRMNPTDLYFH